jgi:serine protease Do
VCLLALALLSLEPAAAAQQVPQSQSEITLSFAPVVRQAAPAVVNIYTRKQVPQAALNPFASDPFFRYFFEGRGRWPPQRQAENSLGSGVIVRADGLIVTNYHVVEDAQEIMVVASDRREFQARVIGSDEAPTSLCSTSRARTCRRCRSAIPTRSRSATWCSRSATRSASARP